MKYKLSIFFVLLVISNLAYAGLCDTTGNKQSITSIHKHGNKAYVSIEPGLADSADAAGSTMKNEVAFDLTEINQKTLMPIFLTALASGKKVQMTYCGGSITHGYNGGSHTVTVVSSIRLFK